MKRRNLLSALGGAGAVGLGGCSIADPLADEELQRRVSIAGQDSVADDHEISINAELLDSKITNMQTARLEITTTNEGSKQAIMLGIAGCGLFNQTEGGSDDPEGLWLHAPDDARSIKRNDNRWERAESAQSRSFLDSGCPAKLYDAGESLTNEYVIWDDYLVDGYLEPGTYQWEDDVSIQDGESDADDEFSTTTWGFSLTIEKPD